MTDQTTIIKPDANSEASKKEQVTGMFDNIAPYYDFLNRLLTARIDVLWRRKAIKKLKNRSVENLLDIATGTADLAIEAHKQLKPKKIIGLDIAKEMLHIGRKKIANRSLSDTIELIHGDSENLPFDDEQFDAITVSFGVRNFGNLEAGLLEMNRVLKAGGKVVVLEFSKPKSFPFKQAYNGYFKYILPVIGKITSKDPKAYKYLYESVQSFPDYERFEAELKKANFKDTTWNALSLGICTIYTGIK